MNERCSARLPPPEQRPNNRFGSPNTTAHAKREIRIATLFKTVPNEFLRMITVHELAHLKERQHDKAFYSLCAHMEPRYHQLEFEVRVYLTHLETSGARLWEVTGMS